MNPNLAYALYDASDAVRGLRSDWHTVLLHCVTGEQRMPSVAVAYTVLLDHDVDDARSEQQTLPTARTQGLLWWAADTLGR